MIVTLVYNDKGQEYRKVLPDKPKDIKQLKKLCSQILGESLTLDCDYILYFKKLKIELDKDDLTLSDYYQGVDKIEIHISHKSKRPFLEKTMNIIQASMCIGESLNDPDLVKKMMLYKLQKLTEALREKD